MNKEVLCTVDFSEASKDVLRYAVNLSKQYGNHVTVLYTYRLLNSQNGEAFEMRRRIEQEAKEHFLGLEKEVLMGSGVTYDFKVEVGFVSNRVREHAKKRDISFLVMGKKMNTANKESFDELAENLNVPLVIVP